MLDFSRIAFTRKITSRKKEHSMAGAIRFSQVVTEDAIITPVGLAFRDPDKPTSMANQDWLIHFSGVGIVDLQGNNSNDWRRETLFLFPNVTSLLQWAIGFYNIPVPTSSIGHVVAQIQVLEQMVASYAAISSAFEKSSGGADFGFAVDRWWTNDFATGRDPNGNAVPDLFTGINIDLAVRNTNAVIHRVSFQITIKGKIAFVVQN
jgi:hypothetical protein